MPHDIAKVVEEISKVVVGLLKEDAYSIANDLAKIALDLTNGKDIIKISPNGISLGDRVKNNNAIKKKNTIPKHTPGNVVGFDPDTKRYLVLFFPVWYPHGVLVLVSEKELRFIMKPKVEEDTEHVWTDPEKSPDAPRVSIVKAFTDEVLASCGLAVARDWTVTKRKKNKWNLRAVIKRSGVTIPRRGKLVASEMVRGIVDSLQNDVIPKIKASKMDNFVEISSVSAWEAPISHPNISSYAAFELVYKT